jgi:hypothetical protein
MKTHINDFIFCGYIPNAKKKIFGLYFQKKLIRQGEIKTVFYPNSVINQDGE